MVGCHARRSLAAANLKRRPYQLLLLTSRSIDYSVTNSNQYRAATHGASHADQSPFRLQAKRRKLLQEHSAPVVPRLSINTGYVRVPSAVGCYGTFISLLCVLGRDSVPRFYRDLELQGLLPYTYYINVTGYLPMAKTTTARLEVRISVDLQKKLRRAAELQGRTLTDFVIDAVQAAAQRAIDDAHLIRLSQADQERFARAVLAPPVMLPALKRAFARRPKLLRVEV